MTNKEIVDALKYALAVSESEGGRFLELGCRTGKALLAALEAEPEPLAVVEGWVYLDELKLDSVDEDERRQLQSPPVHVWLYGGDELIPVTVIVTERKGE